MGQGMCAGIRDVSNLAWKLANCVGGRARDSLLDTYQSERVPHAQSYIETAVRLGRLINQADTEAALRAALKAPDGTARMSSIAPSLGSGLQAGNDQHRGVLGWQINQKNGSRFDDVVGQRFALIVKDDLACSINATTNLLTIKTDQNPEANEYLAELGVSAVVLRPDRYILGTADTDEELAGMLSVVQAIA